MSNKNISRRSSFVRTFFLSAILFFASFSVSLAAETTDIRSAGLTPDSPLYFMDQFGEWMRLNVLTFRASSKAKAELEHAEERVSELKELSEKGVLSEDVSRQLTTKYQELVTKFTERFEAERAKGKDVSDMNKVFEQSLSKHIRILDRVADSAPKAAAHLVEDARDTAEEEEDDALESDLEDGEDALDGDEDGNLATVVQQKIERAEAEVEDASAFLASQAAAGVDITEATAQLERAHLFLAQAKGAFADSQLNLAHGLARQSRDIARLVQRPDKARDVVDHTSEKAFEEVLKAEEKIAKAQALVNALPAGDALRSRTETLLASAIGLVTDARAALDADEFILSYTLAHEARSFASSAVDLLEGEDEEEENDNEDESAKDVQKMAEEKIQQAIHEIAKAREKIDERSREGKDVTLALAKLDEASRHLQLAQETLDASDFVTAYMHARHAKSIANDARSGKYAVSRDEEKKTDDNDADGDELDNDADPDDDNDNIPDEMDLDADDDGQLEEEDEEEDDREDEEEREKQEQEREKADRQKRDEEKKQIEENRKREEERQKQLEKEHEEERKRQQKKEKEEREEKEQDERQSEREDEEDQDDDDSDD
ncbi:MAG: hypothetical protein HYV34_03135 [Candidatus Kerfeldbacteria bacterium]|nr:hypothetical protein [Candidatus Kerfeldbacteria bacterium]